MKVSHPNSGSVSGSESSVSRSGKASSSEVKKGESPNAGSVDKKSNSAANAEISQKSKDFAKARAVAADAPDVREDKVADIKRRIAEGSYKTDANSIADRLVDEHLRMPG